MQAVCSMGLYLMTQNMKGIGGTHSPKGGLGYGVSVVP